MNKKLLTLCVSALLAGGMVTPAFATVTTVVNKAQVTLADIADLSSQYYAIEMTSASTFGTNDWKLKATYEGYTLTDNALDGYSLWKVVAHKGGNGVVDGYELVNAYGIPLAIDPDQLKLDKNGSVTVFQITTSNFLVAELPNGTKLAVKYITGTGADEENLKVESTSTAINLQARVMAPASTHLSASDLTGVFGDHFSLQIGKYNDKGEFEQ